MKKFHNIDYTEDSGKKCCEDPNIIASNGFFVCNNCGITFSRIFDDSQRIALTPTEIKNRHTNERVISPIGPRTLIINNKDALGNYLKPKMNNRFGRLAKINKGLINNYERNLWIALPILNRLKHLLKIPDYVYKDAFKIYIKSLRLKLTLGRRISSLLAAAIYSAIRIYAIPIYILEVADLSQISKKELYQSYKIISKKVLPLLNLKAKKIKSEMFIDKIQESLHLSMNSRNLANNLIKSCEKNGLKTSGKDPKGFAAAALYIASNLNREPRLQKELCEIAFTTETTLRSRIKDLKDYYHIDNNLPLIKH